MTRIRLPTTPVPERPERVFELGDGPVGELCAVLTPRNEAATIAGRVRGLLRRCDGVVVVDDGSDDGTAEAAEAAGARVLRLPAPRGEGVALKAGLRLARELGWIGAVVPGPEDLPAGALDALAAAHVQAPEAMLVGVGPGEAIAGKEWEEAAALARGEEPPPTPDYRPPRSAGWPGAVEDVLVSLVETRFAYPWGSPRVLPLQGVLRRPFRRTGPEVHLELLALCVLAGLPTVEIELPEPPTRRSVTCRKASLRLLAELAPLAAARKVKERLGFGSAYAPPTMSPLGLLLGASLVLLAAGCVKQAPPTAGGADCGGLARTAWPGTGDAEQARDELLAERAGLATIWVEQDITFSGLDTRGVNRLRGILATDGPERLRLRLVGPMAMTVLDFVENGDRWELKVPPAGIDEAGQGEPPAPPEGDAGAEGMPVRPDRLVTLMRSIAPGAAVRWQPGACAVLEELEDGAPVRRLGFRASEAGWVVAEETLLTGGEPELRVLHGDYRAVSEGSPARWPWRSEIRDLNSEAVVVLETEQLRTEGITEAFFRLSGAL